MLSRRVIAQCRWSSSSLRPTRTRIVLLHPGQPRSEFYAKQQAKDAATLYYNVPDRLTGMISTSLLVNDRIRGCLNEYSKREELAVTLDNLSSSVQRAVEEVVPEFGPVEITHAQLFKEGSFEKLVMSIKESGPENVVFLPLFAHYHCSTNGILLDEISRIIDKTTVPMVQNGRHLDNVRVFPDTSVSFNVSAIHRWGDHPALSNLWTDELEAIRGTYDAITFAAPYLRGMGSERYRNSVWATCERVMSQLDFHVPWDVGYYNGWDQWSLPFTRCLYLKTKGMIGKQPNSRRVAVVPITHFFPNFDTFGILPKITEKLNGSTLLHPPSDSSILHQALSELIKNHLLGRRNAQLEEYCGKCSRKHCQRTRLIFAKPNHK